MIYLAGEVNTQMYLDIAKRLDKRPNRINICLNSEGGDLLSGFAIYDRLIAVKNCTITATGENSSAATIILQAAKLRRATPTTQFYFHLSRCHYGDREPTPEESRENNQYKVHLDQIIFEIYTTRMSSEGVREALSRRNFGVDVALRLGIIDEVYSVKSKEKI